MKTETALGLRTVPLASIRSSGFNPRKTFNADADADLQKSVAQHGIVQPLVLRVIPDGFEVVAGERRFRAACALQLVEVPALVRELNDAEALEIALLENLQREDVQPVEEAEGMAKLVESGVYTVATLAARLGKSVAHIYARLQLRGLAPEVVEAVGQGFLPASAAQHVAGLSQDEQAKLVSGALNAKPGEKIGGKAFKAYVDQASEERQAKLKERTKKRDAKAKGQMADYNRKAREEQQARKRRLEWCKTLLGDFRAVLRTCDQREFLGRLMVVQSFVWTNWSEWPLKSERKADTAAITEWSAWKLEEQRMWLVFGHTGKKLGDRDYERLPMFLGVEMPAEPAAADKPAKKAKRKRHEAEQLELGAGK